jgi:hypothetical protein
MIRITFEFPDTGPDGAEITEDEVTTWGNTILKPMASFTGIEVRIVEVTSVTDAGE